jgi:hypothetical protein
MKLNPNNITGVRKQRIYDDVRDMTSVIDKGYKAVLKADNTSWDKDRARDRVEVEGVLERELRRNPDLTWEESSQVDSARLTERSHYKADVQLQGWSSEWGVPISLGAEVSRVETQDKIYYSRRFKSDVQGPNTRKVAVDKQTGEVDIRDYMLGVIRVPSTFNWYSWHANEQSTVDRYQEYYQ